MMNKRMMNKRKMKKYVKEVLTRIQADEYDNIFTSDQIIENCGFVDFLFIGKYNNKPVVWNACITTAKGDYYDKVSAMAMAEAFDKYPDPVGYNFIDSFVDCGNKKGYKEYIDQHPELSNNRYTYLSTRTIELLNSKTISIIPWDIEIDEQYVYGIGLHVRLNVDAINVDDIKQFITEFNQHGMDVFTVLKYDNTPMILSCEELGVELKEGQTFISWVDNFSHDIVALNMEEDLP